jgi:hypothetical protein
MSIDDLIRDRLETLVEVVDDTDAVVAAIEARRLDSGRRRRWPMLTAAAAVVAVLATGATIWLGGEPDRHVVAGPDAETTDGDETPDRREAEGPEGTATTVDGAPTIPPLPPVSRSSLGIDGSPACAEPWSPIYTSVPRVAGATTEGSPPTIDERLDLLGRTPAAPDTDGDGTPDGLGEADEGEFLGQLVVSRATGDLVLGRAGHYVLAPGGQPWIGDLDGDGHDEVLTYVQDEHHEAPPVFVVVPGSLPDGRHDPVEVGTILPGSAHSTVAPVGDLDGDGGEDLGLQPSPSRAVVVSGAALLAESGTGVEADAEPIAAAPQRFHEPLRLGAAAPVFADVDEDAREVVLRTDPPVRLGFAGSVPPLPGNVRVGAFRSGGDRIVVVEQPTSRGHFGTWYWNLDEPCAGA